VARPAHPKRDPEVAVLVVDAVPNLVERRTTTLEGHGFQDYTAADGPAALDRAIAAPPDVSPVSPVVQVLLCWSRWWLDGGGCGDGSCVSRRAARWSHMRGIRGRVGWLSLRVALRLR